MALSTQRASTPPWEYDVFLSFRGADTRKGFVSHLYGELCKWHGLRTFYDDGDLEGGSSIGRELPSAIEKSHTAIVVLSPKYASSKWCLKELTTILQCMEARGSVLPVFYETDPSDVGNQRGCFAEAFAELERNLVSIEDKEKVVQWKANLKRVSKITGKHWKNFKCERELIEDIVKWVSMKVQDTFTLSDSSRKLVGTDYAFEQLSLLLAHDANDVRFIGITGMGGIGKTALAKLVYEKILFHFEVHCFLANVREVCAKKGIVDLAKELLSPFLKNVEIWDAERASILTEKFLRNKKVLLILDDVDELKQLEVLAGNQGWFGKGSRIIVTTRDRRLLVELGIETSYEVQGLNDAEALKLFSLHAFKKDQPEEDFLELSKYFINYAGGLPLALKTLGSALFKRGLDAWISERDNLSKILKPTIFDKLKISYDRLEEQQQKSIFLDVACFHKGKYTEKVIEILSNCNPFGISSRIVIDVLIERSLLYQDHQNCIWMHDLIQEMAWKIVGDESKEPGQRSRLWLFEDINHVFTNNTGTGAIEAISLCMHKVEEVRQWNWEAFSKLHWLRYLEFDNLIFSSGPEFLPCSLRTINWSFYPSKFLPINSQLRFLTQLEMYKSKLVRLWEGKMDLPNLKYINLRDSNKLISTPDFSGLSKLETLDLTGCKKLVEIHPSVTILKKLQSLRLRGCESIKSLPSEFEMDSLEILSLDECSNLKRIPEFGEQMKNLRSIDLKGTAIEDLPSSIGHLVGLEQLSLPNCENLKKIPEFGEQMKNLQLINLGGTAIEDLPSSIGHLVGLQELYLHDCKNLKKIPEFGEQMKNLEFINLSWTAIEDLPSSIGHLVGLTELLLADCENLKKIPEFGEQMKNLQSIRLSGTAIEDLPSSIGHLVGLQGLDLGNCKNLKKIPEFGEQKKNLEYIDLCGTAIEDLPSSIGHLVGLRWLDLHDCKNLKKIPEFGKQMKNLQYINLSGTAIEDLPSSIRHLVGLQELHLDDCKNLKKIPEFGKQMKNLQYINLSGTAIGDLPSSIGHLVGLKELRLGNCKNLLNLPMVICSLKSLQCLVFDKSDEGWDGKARDGDIPNDIGCLSFLEQLHLSGNNFVSLPESIRCLSKLQSLDLERCKNLQELPPLPSEGGLEVNVRNCTSLKRLLDPSKMMSRYISTDIESSTYGEKLFCYDFICLNNIALAQDEGWNNTLLSMILKFATQGRKPWPQGLQDGVIPGSEIPGWFLNQSVGHSVNVELPPPSCTDWLGIAFCVVFEDPKKNLANPAALPHEFIIRCSDIIIYGRDMTCEIGSLISDHLKVFYLDREKFQQEQFLFETYFHNIGESEVKADLNVVKKCGARLVHKQDLEALSQTLKILK